MTCGEGKMRDMFLWTKEIVMTSHTRSFRHARARSVARTGLLVLVGVLVGGVVRPDAATMGNERAQAGSRQRLHGLLAERYRLCKDIVESLEPLVNAGRVDIAERRDAAIAMHRAEADLCATVDERIQVYENMVNVLRRHEQQAANRADAGRISEAEVMEANVATIEAQIELERLRLAREASR